MPSSGSHPKPFGVCVKSVVTNWAGVIIMPMESRRMGGRAGRHLLRNTPVPVDERPVKPGQRGGRYQPLTEIEIQQIHHAVLDVLAEIGLADRKSTVTF